MNTYLWFSNCVVASILLGSVVTLVFTEIAKLFPSMAEMTERCDFRSHSHKLAYAAGLVFILAITTH